MTNSKEGRLYALMLTGKPVTHWDAMQRFRMLDVRKAMTRITRKAKSVGRIMNRRWCVRDGIRYREYWLGTSTDSRKRAQ